MQLFVTFLVEHWQLILSGLLAVISVVVAILRKKPVNSLDAEIYKLVVNAILKTEAEDFDDPKIKLAYAVQLVLDWLRVKYPGLDAKRYASMITYRIEEILYTPTKKGGLGREQEKNNA